MNRWFSKKRCPLSHRIRRKKPERQGADQRAGQRMVSTGQEEEVGIGSHTGKDLSKINGREDLRTIKACATSQPPHHGGEDHLRDESI